jgi:LPS-assembly protein
MKNLAALFLVCACAAIRAPAAFAQAVTDGVLINADAMDRDMDRGLVRLNGHVQVVFQSQHLSCDRATLNLKTQTLRAEGHVILSNERVHVEGDRVVFNYKKNTGFIYNGFVQSGQVVFEGDIVEKVGDNHYLASNAEYTACETCPPGWSFSGRSIDAEIGGYARIKRPVFKIGGWPILILPSLIVPLKSARQSGFLVPSMDYSGKGGFAFGESYFWAIDRSQDLTLTGKRYALRGNKLHGDYRYVLSDSSAGQMQGAWIPDRAFQHELGLPKTLDRWFLHYTHHYEMPDNYVHRADINAVSDLRYPRDFPEELIGHGDPALENKASVSHSTDNHYYSAEIDMYTNMLEGWPTARNDDAVHRFPELKYSFKDRQLFEHGPYFSMDLDYVNFARNKYNYDDMHVVNGSLIPIGDPNFGGVSREGEITRDGSFDPTTDIFRTGQRLDAQPSLTYPFRIARKFDLLPTVSYRETQYRFYSDDEYKSAFNNSAARRYLQTDIRAKTEFSRVFGNSSPDSKATRWKHSIEPEVGYSQIPWMRRPDHPFFGDFRGVQYSRQYNPISDADLTNPNTRLQFDYEDRTFERKVVDFNITNRLTRKVWVNGEPDYETAALFRLWQSYDFNEVHAPHPHPWSSINGLLDMRFGHFETNTTAEYNGYAKITNTSSRIKVMTTPQNFLQFSYTRSFILTDDYKIAENGRTRDLGLGAGLLTKYVEFAGEINYSDITYKIQSWNYGLNIRPPGHCWLIRVDHRQILGGDAQIHLAASFDFGGENKSGLY